MAIKPKHEQELDVLLRDTRSLSVRIADKMSNPGNSAALFALIGVSFYMTEYAVYWGDVIFILGLLYFWFLHTRDRSLAFKLPMSAKFKDQNNTGPGKNMKPEGILYLGNVDKTNEEVWFTNSDIRTHFLYLGTTGAGKTEGLKSLVANALCWGSGFVYVDGKADTDLWSSLSALVRRFGRDDDIMVLNYMTGNSDVKAPSNTMNPFSSGSASYLTNMLVSLMPEASGDNVMWKERAVSLVASIMPALTWKRDNQDMPMAIGSIRKYLILNNIIALSRDTSLPAHIQEGVRGYLDTLPGYVDEAFDDNGQVKPPGPNQPQVNTEVPFQQHGYLSMQLTRALQSLGDEYGYIFDAQAADVDMLDVVLNRRILIVLIPALEKSSDEIANLGKIVSAALKGMMGASLGTTVEGESASIIENKPTHSMTPFMTVFDEVGYYTAEGMAVMAAQARSLGFCLIYAAQDLPALEKRVKEEARSITANCNIKLFGKLEDPTQTKEFFENTVGQALVTEVQGFQTTGGLNKSYSDTKQAGTQLRPRASYDGIKKFKEGEAVCTFGESVVDIRVYYSNPGFAKAMRVTRYVGLPPIDEAVTKHAAQIKKLRDRLVKSSWTAEKADVQADTSDEIDALKQGMEKARKAGKNVIEQAIISLISVHSLSNEIETKEEQAGETSQAPEKSQPAQSPAATKPPPPPASKEPPEIAAKPQKQETPPQADKPKQVEAEAKTESKPETKETASNPMGFFGKQKKEDSKVPPPPPKEAAGTPPPKTTETPAGQQPQTQGDQAQEPSKEPISQESASQTQATDTAQQEAGQTSQSIEQPPAQQKTTEQEPSQKPASWQDIMGQTTSGEKNALSRLDKQTASVIEDAAGNMRKSIFKSEMGDTEAAE